MCAPVSVSMSPMLSYVSVLPAILVSAVAGISGIALVFKSLKKPAGGE